MAKIYEEYAIIKISELIKDNCSIVGGTLTNEVLRNIETLLEEYLGKVVEVSLLNSESEEE